MKKDVKGQVKSGIYLFFDWFYKLVILNFTFLFFAALGGFVTSLGPSMQASHYIMYKWLKKEEPKFFKTFWREYYNNYFKSFFTTIPYLLVFFSLSISFYLLNNNLKSNTFAGVSYVAAIFILFFFLVGFMFVFFFKNRYNLKSRESIKYSLTLPFGRFLYLFVILLFETALFVLSVVMLKFFLIFLNFGLYFFIIEYFGGIAFKRFTPDTFNREKNLQEDIEIVKLKEELRIIEEEKRKKKALKNEFKKMKENKNKDKDENTIR